MIKLSLSPATALLVWMALFTSCSGVDIGDEQAVMDDLQGTWIGLEQTKNFYRHIKLNISGNTYHGWIQYSDSAEEPDWTPLPAESGTFSLSSVMANTDIAPKFRRLSFSIPKACCGDNSVTAKTLSQTITYQEDKGLFVGDHASMVHE